MRDSNRVLERGTAEMDDRQNSLLLWFATGLACLYFGWSYYSLSKATGIFSSLFGSLGVELPVSTRLVLATHILLYPLLFIGASAVVIAKELLVRSNLYRLLITLMVVFVVYSVNFCIAYVLLLPLQDLAKKLGGAS